MQWDGGSDEKADLFKMIFFFAVNLKIMSAKGKKYTPIV